MAGRDALRKALLAMVPQVGFCLRTTFVPQLRVGTSAVLLCWQIDELQKKRELMKQAEMYRQGGTRFVALLRLLCHH